MSIVEASTNDAEMVAAIISVSNKDVAKRFGLNRENSPKHPSFCTKDWVVSDFSRGEKYFIFQEEGVNVGCVALENPLPSIAYLNRLAVLPANRRHGVGRKLVTHVLEYSRCGNIKEVSVGIIALHTELKNWYLKLGFIQGETKKFSHLPFDVTYMCYKI